MQRQSVETIVKAVNDAGVRYLIAGGLAVVAHGYLRFTADVDLILDLKETNPRKDLAALVGLGYRPRPPVRIEQFADRGAREQRVRAKGLTEFLLCSPQHQATEVHLFVESPLDFEKAFQSASRLEVAPNVSATFVGLEDLIALKGRAGRPQDLADIDQMRRIREACHDS